MAMAPCREKESDNVMIKNYQPRRPPPSQEGYPEVVDLLPRPALAFAAVYS